MNMETFMEASRQKENQKTLRDEFAMAALNAVSHMENSLFETFETFGEIAVGSYLLADAMLEARKAKGE